MSSVILRRLMILWFSLVLQVGLALADAQRISSDLLGLLANPLQPVTVVVQFKSAPGPLDLLNITV